MIVDVGPDLFGHCVAPVRARDVDLHYAIVTAPEDEDAVLRRAEWVERFIGPPPPEMGSFDRAAYRELVSAYVSGRHMSCIALSARVLDRHLSWMYRVLGQRWRGSLDEKVERLRDLDTPVSFLRPKLRALVGAARALGVEAQPRPAALAEDGTPIGWEDRLALDAREAASAAIFVMTRLPAHLMRVAKGSA
ncbi:hypothetical protein [Salinarimonas rosea]|uniref:hypothetical protein n=1 Tax=Salinarimonas rosea TaxID=552063 RepID=UPI000429768C|nr:hypothetical protein [Salinarimonas rosea]